MESKAARATGVELPALKKGSSIAHLINTSPILTAEYPEAVSFADRAGRCMIKVEKSNRTVDT
jgi:hypothetical protein